MLRNYFYHLSILLGILALYGCVTAPPAEPAPVQPIVAEVTIPSEQLHQWLEAAALAIDRDQLTYPEADSALAIYRRILSMDPDQEDAHRGLEHIVEIFVARAMRALERRQFASARSMLARARLILPNHPSIEPSAEQIRLIMTADRQMMKLSQPDLQAASSQLQAALSEFAAAGERDCRFQINARNDQQGRWIYQALSKGSSGGRLRAQLQTRLPASVERLCFNP